MSSHRRPIGSKAKFKRKVVFPKNRSGGMATPENNPARDGDGDGEQEQEQAQEQQAYWSAAEQVPAMHLKLPLLIDGHVTETSRKQLGVAQMIMKEVSQTPLPLLERATHVDFLLGPLHNGLSSRYTGLDASRPWIFYWCINALTLLGEDVGRYNERAISSLKPLQHKDGGFGGGNGQSQHMAAVYAVVLTLAITAHHAARDLPEAERMDVYARSFSWINRARLLQWIRRTKLPNGGFKVNEGGEEDVRAGYCALVTLALLGYDEDELKGDPAQGEKPLLDGVLEYFKRCQTWEGGIAAKENSEAHGGYAFCVLAGLCLLGEPREMLSKYLDLDRFISWLSARQYAPEGGFSGRTNKLVDGCYSTWVGGCWALVEAAANGIESAGSPVKMHVGSMWSRKALIRYILTCCQGPRGGLRDKPGIYPDFYHSNYVLIGLSAAQHYYYYDDDEDDDEYGGASSAAEGARSPFRHAFRWKASRNVPKPSDPRDGRAGGWEEGLVPSEEDRVGMQHPLFNIPLGAEAQLESWWRLFKGAQ
ncbi:CAAX farnesyltransferase (FTase) subunit beta [Orbilia brochopaga]|uniref:Protein farnesyltransferase subunit beta n=1 Tax=Orbilia brochopaga TaxID=3140254 RepID=A0AAV9U2M8_9PEZI